MLNLEELFQARTGFSRKQHWSRRLQTIGVVTRTATVSLMLFVASCDAYKWPPYEDKLRSMFLESKPILVELQSEMIADGLKLVGPGRERLRSDQPVLTGEQVRKYGNLFERLPYHWSMLRNDDATFVDVYGPSPRGMGKVFAYTLAHREIPANLPSCDRAGWDVSCGMCTVDLGDNWSIQYFWHPKDIGPDWDGRLGEGLPTMEEIQEQHEQELGDCIDAGMREMGVDSDLHLSPAREH